MNVEIFFNVIVEEGFKLFLSLNSFLKNHTSSTFKKGYYMWMWKYISVILNKFLIKIPYISLFFQKWLEDQEKIRMEQLEKLGINEDDIGGRKLFEGT